MKRLFPLLFLLCISNIFACDVTDDIGQTIHLKQPAKRIISLAPHVTETLFAIHADPFIVGVMKGSDYPEQAKKITIIGSYLGMDLERVISLHPDLIISWDNTFSRQLSVLKKMGIPVYVSSPHQLEDIPRTIKNLGCLTGNESEANQIATTFSKQLSELKKKYHRDKKIKVFYQIGGAALMTINKDSWINQIIDVCGGQNVFANLKFIAPEVDVESIIVANPEVMLADDQNDDWKKRWSKWSQLSAVKEHHLYTMDADLIERPGPRLWQGAQRVCQALQNSSVNKS